jgi:hypothetical protein
MAPRPNVACISCSTDPDEINMIWRDSSAQVITRRHCHGPQSIPLDGTHVRFGTRLLLGAHFEHSLFTNIMGTQNSL